MVPRNQAEEGGRLPLVPAVMMKGKRPAIPS